MSLLDTLLGTKSQTRTLKIEVTSLDCHRMIDALEMAIKECEQKKLDCSRHGFWVAASLTWPATLDILYRLKDEAQKTLDKFKQP